MAQDHLHSWPEGAIAVIFISWRNRGDADGYAAAAAEMVSLAATQPGYLGIESVRAADGQGITISIWADEAAAMLWRDEPRHAAIRERGRALWYDRYAVIIAQVSRSYGWWRQAGNL